jgi:hypothetical protein
VIILNNLPACNSLTVGQKLKIPMPDGHPPAPTEP